MAVLRLGSSGHCPTPTPLSLMVCPPPPQLYCPNFFSRVLLPMNDVANGVDDWKWLEIAIKIMNYKSKF